MTIPKKKEISWKTQAIFLAISMYFIMVFVFPMMSGESITLREILLGIPIYGLAGFIYGKGIDYATKKRQKRSTE